MTLKEYLERVKSGEKLAIHTPTQEDFDKLMAELGKMKIRWLSGEKAREVSWSFIPYNRQTCINIIDEDMQYCSMDYYLEHGYTIIPFSSLTFDEPTTTDEAIKLLYQAIELLERNK